MLEKHARSGLSLRAFAEGEGVSPNTLAYWKYKRCVARESKAELVPVRVIEDVEPTVSELVVEIGRARVRVTSGCDFDFVARVIAILRASC